MRGFMRLALRHPLILGLVLAMSCAPAVEASPLVVHETFSTSGTVDTAGVTGTPVVSFRGVDDGSFSSSTPFIDD